MPLSRLLVGDDGSAGATAAREWARAVATAAGADVVVATVAEEASGAGPVGGHQLTGPAAPALLAYAEEVGADLLVVGRRGRGGFNALRLGSTAHEVAELAVGPVAVVPASSAPSEGGWPFATIAVGLDGSSVSAGALAWVASAARQSSAAVVAVHALEIAPAFAAAGLVVEYGQARATIQAEVQSWCEPLGEAGVPFTIVVEEGGPAGVLLHAVTTQDADLLVVGRRVSGSFPGMSMGSAAHRALGFAPCPTVVVPAAG
jgi:nucleotide-binding universal stress UspA family protein